jgi:hypothetical protein
MYLHSLNNYSEYVNSLIDKDRLVNGDQKLIDARIHEHQQEIERLKELGRTKHNNSEQLQQILEQSLQKFQQRNHDVVIGDSQNRDWIKRIILPEVKRAGGKLDEYKLLEMFKAGKINV